MYTFFLNIDLILLISQQLLVRIRTSENSLALSKLYNQYWTYLIEIVPDIQNFLFYTEIGILLKLGNVGIFDFFLSVKHPDL